MTQISIHATAEGIANDLWAKLKAGTLTKIGIDDIRAAILARLNGVKITKSEMEQLEERTTRRVVERC